jgi:hypothetical protein
MINSRLALSNAERFDLKFVTGSFSPKTAGLLYNLSPYYGFPSGGAFNPGNTTSGVVPVASSTNTLFPALPQVGTNQELRIGGVFFEGTDQGQPTLWDRLWHAGPFTSSGGSSSFSSQPSFMDRVGPSSGSDIFLIMEIVSDFSINPGNPSVTLTDLSGTTYTATAPIPATPKANNLFVFQTSPGQRGVKSVVSLSQPSGNGTGTFNLVVARMLFEVPGAGVYRPLESQMAPWTKRGLIWIPPNAALWLTWRAATTNAVTATLGMEIFKG